MELELLGIRPVEPEAASRRWRLHVDRLTLTTLLREALVARHVAAVLAVVAIVAILAGEPAR